MQKKNNQNVNSKEYRDRYQKKLRKLKEIIKTSVDFIQKTVPTTREKDKNELLKLGTFFEKISTIRRNKQNYICQIRINLNEERLIIVKI